MSHSLTLPARPLTVGRLALSLTGATITGSDGKVFDGVNWPVGPYVVRDAAGVVLGEAPLPHLAERIAVRLWRQKVAATDYCLTREAVKEQLRLKVELRAAEAHVQALNARMVAIDAEYGIADLSDLDSALATYSEAVEAHRAAECEWADYDVAETRAAA